MKRKWRYIALFFLLFSFWGTMKGQVTIGEAVDPQNFSILELISHHTGGLRLPHLTTAERDALDETDEFQAQKRRGDYATAPGLGLGLVIYNTDTNCTEYWNGYKWVSLCLGTADITLKSSCGGYYNPQSLPMEPANGDSPNCEYTPEDNPTCTVPSGKAYEVYLTAGAAYANLQVDELTSAFSIGFSPNNSNLTRNAVVRVVNNCTGEFKDFVFPQAGADCPGKSDPSLNGTNFSLCSGGSVFVHVTNREEGVDYIWTYGGVIVHTGNWYEIKRAGTYKVYADLLGCGTPAEINVTDADDVTAPPSTMVNATNGGILCFNGNVLLTANTTAAQTVLWYHNGIPLDDGNKNKNPLLLSGAENAGEWFAAVIDGSCVSHSSNVLTLLDNTQIGALEEPEATVNDQPLDGSITVCKGGTLKLKVTNKYPVGTQYEWFDNGVSIGKGTDPVMYLVPKSTDNMVLSVTVSDQSGSCPNTAASKKATVSYTAPGATSINYGATEAAICGKTPAALIVDYNAGDGHYEWMRDGFAISGETNQTLMTDVPGKYTVRYKNSNGCWSVVSVSIDVVQTATLNMSWNIEPTDVVKGDQVTYSVNSAPMAEQYTWSFSPSNSEEIESITPIGNGSSAVVQYSDKNLFSEPAPEVTLIVQSVGHPCGDVTLKKTIKVKDGCIKGTSVNLTPNGTITMTQGKPITFSASSNASNNEGDLKYEWFVDNTSQGTASATNTFTYTPANPGEYTVSVRVTNKCTDKDADNLRAEAILNVKADPINYTPDTGGDFKLTGKDCFDIAQSNFSGSCGTITQRPGDFLNGNRDWVEGKEWVYTFTATTGYTELQFVTDDPSVLIKSEKSEISNGKYILTFDESVLTKALGKNRANALNLTVYALFKVGGEEKRVSLNVKVQDCMCGCGAYISKDNWKVFMCHNLGADETRNPFVPQSGVHGAKYKFGAKNASLTMAQDQGSASAIANWTSATTYPYQATGNWNMQNNNPCPDGFIVPTKEDWEGVIKNNTRTFKGTWNDSAANYSSGVEFGIELFLPAAGTRYHATGALSFRGLFGYYWSTTSSAGVSRLNFNNKNGVSVSAITERQAGYSVRCMAE